MAFESKYADNAGKSIGLSFIKAYNVWHRRIKSKLSDLGLTHPQFVVLASLGYLEKPQEEVKQIDIANNADIDVMTCSTIVRNLEKLALVYRCTSKQDTRAKVLSITDEVNQILSQALTLVEGVDTAFFSVLDDDQAVFNQLLQELIANGK